MRWGDSSRYYGQGRCAVDKSSNEDSGGPKYAVDTSGDNDICKEIQSRNVPEVVVADLVSTPCCILTLDLQRLSTRKMRKGGQDSVNSLDSR